MATKVEQALELVKNGLTVYAAAKEIGVPSASVYASIHRAEHKRLKGYVNCPTCGSSVLKTQLAKTKKS